MKKSEDKFDEVDVILIIFTSTLGLIMGFMW